MKKLKFTVEIELDIEKVCTNEGKSIDDPEVQARLADIENGDAVTEAEFLAGLEEALGTADEGLSYKIQREIIK